MQFIKRWKTERERRIVEEWMRRNNVPADMSQVGDAIRTSYGPYNVGYGAFHRLDALVDDVCGLNIDVEGE